MDAARKLFVDMIIPNELPFRFVENYSLKRFCNVTNPKFRVILSHYTITRDDLKIYNEEGEVEESRKRS